ncbi:hypothetical protein AB0G81_02645, partial [Streptomyces asoensis]
PTVDRAEDLHRLPAAERYVVTRRPNADSAPEPFALSEAPPPLPRTGGAASEVLRRAAAR